jgi:hypothetical protein
VGVLDYFVVVEENRKMKKLLPLAVEMVDQ